MMDFVGSPQVITLICPSNNVFAFLLAYLNSLGSNKGSIMLSATDVSMFVFTSMSITWRTSTTARYSERLVEKSSFTKTHGSSRFCIMVVTSFLYLIVASINVTLTSRSIRISSGKVLKLFASAVSSIARDEFELAMLSPAEWYRGPWSALKPYFMLARTFTESRRCSNWFKNSCKAENTYANTVHKLQWPVIVSNVSDIDHYILNRMDVPTR